MSDPWSVEDIVGEGNDILSREEAEDQVPLDDPALDPSE